MTALDEARRRATAFLTGTSYFDQLGLEGLAGDARMVARLTLELADELEAERSARVALGARAERLQAIIGEAAYEACKRAAA